MYKLEGAAVLSDSKLKSYYRKKQEKQIVLSDRDGLYVRISKAGSVSFFIRYRYAGKQDQLTIGPYPEVTLKDAREKTIYYRAMVVAGKNPKIQKRIELQSTQSALAFCELIEMWYEREVKDRKKNHASILRAIKNHMYPLFKDAPIEDITTHHFYDAFDNVAKTAPHQVQSLISNVRQSFSMAVRRKIISENPLVGISSRRDFGIERNEGERILDDEEIKRLLTYIFNREYNRTGLITFLALFFGCRMSELRLAKIEHFDFFNMTWTVPPENHKTGRKTKRPIIRPIISEIVPLLESLMSLSFDGVYLLTSQKSGSMLKPDFWTHYPKNINKWLSRNNLTPILHWSMHDLRRTQRTNMSSITELHIAEIMQGRKLPGMLPIYDKYFYLEKQKKAYTEWWYRLQRTVSNETNIIRIDDKKVI